MAVGLADAIPDTRCRSLYLGLSFFCSGTGIDPIIGESSSSFVLGVRSNDCLWVGVMALRWVTAELMRREMLEGLRTWDQPDVRKDDGPGDRGMMLERETFRAGVTSAYGYVFVLGSAK